MCSNYPKRKTKGNNWIRIRIFFLIVLKDFFEVVYESACDLIFLLVAYGCKQHLKLKDTYTKQTKQYNAPANKDFVLYMIWMQFGFEIHCIPHLCNILLKWIDLPSFECKSSYSITFSYVLRYYSSSSPRSYG